MAEKSPPETLRVHSGMLQSPSNPVSRWCTSSAKRCFDFLGASILLIVLGPAFLLVAIVIRVGSGGPVFFRQARMAQDGRQFRIFKFRTMYDSSATNGPVLTRAGDSRLTREGVFLRRFKLDELPQLINVLRGEMSFVGPRPQPCKLWNHFADLPVVLRVRPGITGVATLAFRNEEQLLQKFAQEEVEEVYIRSVMPIKMKMDVEYLERATFRTDLSLIFQTVGCLFGLGPSATAVPVMVSSPKESNRDEVVVSVPQIEEGKRACVAQD